MALYAGEAVRVRAQVIDPDTEATLVLADGEPAPTATIDLWSPGNDPARDTDRRSNPTHSGSMTYRAEKGDFIAYVSTEGDGIDESATPGTPWEAGRWFYRVSVTGQAFTNWEYGNFRLSA